MASRNSRIIQHAMPCMTTVCRLRGNMPKGSAFQQTVNTSGQCGLKNLEFLQVTHIDDDKQKHPCIILTKNLNLFISKAAFTSAMKL